MRAQTDPSTNRCGGGGHRPEGEGGEGGERRRGEGGGERERGGGLGTDERGREGGTPQSGGGGCGEEILGGWGEVGMRKAGRGLAWGRETTPHRPLPFRKVSRAPTYAPGKPPGLARQAPPGTGHPAGTAASEHSGAHRRTVPAAAESGPTASRRKERAGGLLDGPVPADAGDAGRLGPGPAGGEGGPAAPLGAGSRLEPRGLAAAVRAGGRPRPVSPR